VLDLIELVEVAERLLDAVELCLGDGVLPRLKAASVRCAGDRDSGEMKRRPREDRA
jgi:hypothetical protein